MREKRKLSARGIYSITDNILKIPTVGVCISKFKILFSNFRTIQRLMSPRASFYGDRFKCMWEKERVLGGEKGKQI